MAVPLKLLYSFLDSHYFKSIGRWHLLNWNVNISVTIRSTSKDATVPAHDDSLRLGQQIHIMAWCPIEPWNGFKIHPNMAPVSPANCSGFLTSEIREKAISRLKQTSCGYREPSTSKSSNFHYKHLNIYYVPQAHMEKAMAPHSSTLARKIPWTEDPGRLQSMGSRRVGHDWATSLSLFTYMHWRRKWQPTPVFLPGESQGRGRTVGRDYSDLAAAVAVQARGAECLVDPYTTKWSAYKASLTGS